MTKRSVTYEMVQAAMTDLKAAGQDPGSVRLVRSITKTGSNDTVKKLIVKVQEDWRSEAEYSECKRVTDLCEQYPLPESIAEFVASISLGLEKLPLLYAENAACDRASNIRDGDMRLAALTIEHRKVASELGAAHEREVTILSNKLASTDAEITELRTANIRLDSELHKCQARAATAEEKLARAENQIKQLTATVTENTETQQALQQLLDFAKNLPPQTDRKIAAAK